MKRRLATILGVLMVLVLLTTCLVGGTFAKYVSRATASDSARVALWDWEIDDVDVVTDNSTKTFTCDLFSAVKDTGGADDEEDISIADGSIIAPGTSGSIEIKIKNLSEVDGTYEIDFTLTNADNIPIEFALDGTTTWKSDISDLDIAAAELVNTTGTHTHIIYWRWVIGADATADEADTHLGIAGIATVTVKADVTFTQVD